MSADLCFSVQLVKELKALLTAVSSSLSEHCSFVLRAGFKSSGVSSVRGTRAGFPSASPSISMLNKAITMSVLREPASGFRGRH